MLVVRWKSLDYLFEHFAEPCVEPFSTKPSCPFDALFRQNIVGRIRDSQEFGNILFCPPKKPRSPNYFLWTPAVVNNRNTTGRHCFNNRDPKMFSPHQVKIDSRSRKVSLIGFFIRIHDYAPIAWSRPLQPKRIFHEPWVLRHKQNKLVIWTPPCDLPEKLETLLGNTSGSGNDHIVLSRTRWDHIARRVD